MTATTRRAVFVTVSEKFTNSNQSWEYAGIFRNHSGEYRVHVRANAYEDQSYAKVSQWGVGGWQFYESLPTEEWYADAPRYGKKALDHDDHDHFNGIRNELLAILANGKWGLTDPPEIRPA